jgi:hypothetical protein
MKAWMPTPAELARETLIVLGGAFCAALIISHVPALRDFIKEAWGTPSGH